MKYILFLYFFSFSLGAQETINTYSLMPWPQKIEQKEGNFVLKNDFKVQISGQASPRLYAATTRFLRRLDGRTGLFLEQGFLTPQNQPKEAALQIHCTTIGKVGLYADESYQLNSSSNGIQIQAATDLGAMHALETLLQMLENNATTFYFPALEIVDFPRFTWRGLMIDAARHFQPISVIKRNLDAMAAVKMNVFHWHLVDDQGWRIEIKKFPQLTQLASDGLFYTQTEIKELVQYAEDRGILVVPEIDVPGHASALLTAFPEIGSMQQWDKNTYSIERNAGIFTPTLDPTNPKTYQVLSTIFDEVCPLFPGKYFHIGGDENEGKAWDENKSIQEFKLKNKLENNHDLQTYFTLQLLPMLQKHQKEMMGWEEIMTKNMSKEAIIHSWKGVNEGTTAGQSLITAAKNGFRTVLSNGYYIDLMQSVEEHYKVDPLPQNAALTSEEKNRILGGEATMWSELTSPETIDSRIWPRTAAIAERLWSDAKITSIQSMRQRLKIVSNRLEELGITHIKNKEMILRNVSNYQSTRALNDFASICEPLKIYSRNKGGTEYKMFSPLTLFADACTPDAEDALTFHQNVSDYLKNPTPISEKEVIYFLKKWIKTHSELKLLSQSAPLVQPLLPLSQSLSELSELLLLKMNKKEAFDFQKANAILENCHSKEHADVELAVYPDLKALVLHQN